MIIISNIRASVEEAINDASFGTREVILFHIRERYGTADLDTLTNNDLEDIYGDLLYMVYAD